MSATAQICEVMLKGDKVVAGPRRLEVPFNPASLKVSLSNKIQDEDAASGKAGAGGGKTAQSTRGSTAKLDTELIFDTTQSGADVRTDKNGSGILKQLATAPDGVHPAPPMIEFRWGSFVFIGVIESFSETLDFWAAEGIPLRSTVQISVQETKRVDPQAAKAKLAGATRQTVVPVPQGGRGTTDVAADHGNAGAGRAVAAANGIEDMRMAGGGAVAVSASVELQAAASFSLSASASASAGAGASLGFGIGASASAGASAGFGGGASAGFGAGASAGFGGGASAGFGGGASAGFDAGASAGFGAGASAGFEARASASYGASATAGVSASAGAFAGLGTSKTTSVGLPFDPVRLLPQGAPIVTSSAQFDVTGKLVSTGGGVTAQASAGVVLF